MAILIASVPVVIPRSMLFSRCWPNSRLGPARKQLRPFRHAAAVPRLGARPALLLVRAAAAAAHDIPNDVTVQAFVKPEGQRLHLLVRVPLNAMRDVDFPTARAGLPGSGASRRAAPATAATLWLSGFIEIYEGDTRLCRSPRIVATRVSLPSRQVLCHPTKRRWRTSRAAAAARHGALLEPGDARRAVRVSDSLGSIRFFDPPRARGWGCASSRCFGSCRRAARFAPSNSPAIRAWSGSTRGGIRPRCGSSSWGSSTSWTAPTTCCSCSAS